MQSSLTPSSTRALVVIGCSLLLAFALLSNPIGALASPSISLAWDPNPDTELVGYNIYRSTQSGVFNSPAMNGSALLKTEAFTDSSVQVGQTYYYVVKAVSSDGTESSPSNQVQAIITSVPDTSAPQVSISIIPLR